MSIINRFLSVVTEPDFKMAHNLKAMAISAVESTPTYKRTREILDSINSQATGDYVHEEPVASTPDEPVQGTIKFFS